MYQLEHGHTRGVAIAGPFALVDSARNEAARISKSLLTTVVCKETATLPHEVRFVAAGGQIDLAENCPSCHGTGTFHFGPGSSSSCSACNGRGWKRRP